MSSSSIVDSLTHTTPDGRWFHTGHDASESRLLREMDAAGVERAVLVGLAGHISNQYVAQTSARHADRLIACGSFNPAAYENAAAAAQAFRAEFNTSSFRALKLHPRLNGYDPLDARCLAVLGEVAQMSQPLPVWMDTLFQRPGATLQRPVVESIRELVVHFPQITFVLLHGGGTWLLHVAEAIRDCPNAFLDFSFTVTRYAGTSVEDDLRGLLGTFDRRLIFGSDFPEYTMADALAVFGRVSAGLDREKCANILGRNVSRILGLEAA